MYKLISILFLSALLVSCFTGCQKSKIQDLTQRLDSFRDILPQDLRAKFDSKNYPAVERGIDSLLTVDPDFKRRYEKIKDDEAINVFTSQEVVDFFKTYFVEEIEKEKQR